MTWPIYNISKFTLSALNHFVSNLWLLETVPLSYIFRCRFRPLKDRLRYITQLSNIVSCSCQSADITLCKICSIKMISNKWYILRGVPMSYWDYIVYTRIHSDPMYCQSGHLFDNQLVLAGAQCASDIMVPTTCTRCVRQDQSPYWLPALLDPARGAYERSWLHRINKFFSRTPRSMNHSIGTEGEILLDWLVYASVGRPAYL